jgi:hypothetical protein
VYDKGDAHVTFGSITDGTRAIGASTSGAALFFNVTAAASFAQGFWTVTAP